MRSAPSYSVIIIAFIFLLASSALSHATDQAEETQEPSVGLVLSGGGAKGFAHIGVLKVLEEVNMPIDYITGTSMGSVVGGLYAIGYRSDDLEEIVINTNWTRLFADERSRRHIPVEEKLWEGRFQVTLPIHEEGMWLPSGVVGGHQISILLSRLTWEVHDIEEFNKFPIPFAAIATDIETGEPVVLNSGYLAEAMRASIAIPSIFTPIRIEDRYLVDGGLVRNMPVEDVINLGADYVLGVNVSTQLQAESQLQSLLSILNQTISIAMLENIRDQEFLADKILRPELSDFSIQDFGDAEEIIKLGEISAREYYDELKQIADSLNQQRTDEPDRTEIEPISTVNIDEIEIQGLELISEERVFTDLKLETGVDLELDNIEEAIDRLYSTPFFERITYRIERREESNKLIITVSEVSHDDFNIGFHYETQRRASLQFNVAMRNIRDLSSTLRFTLELGEEISTDAQYFYYPMITALGTRVGARTRLNYTRHLTDVYVDEEREASVLTDTFYGELMTGPIINTIAMINGGFRAEHFYQSRIVGTTEFPEGWGSYYSVFGDIWLDSFNRNHFPDVGQSLRIRTDFTIPAIDNSLGFSRHEVKTRGFYRLANRFTLGHYVRLGQTYGTDLPLHRQIMTDNYPDAPGFLLHELAGPAYVAGHGLIRVEPWDDRYLTGRAGITNAFDNLTDIVKGEPLHFGWALEAGLRTLAGPAKIAFAGSQRNPFLLMIKIGFDL